MVKDYFQDIVPPGESDDDDTGSRPPEKQQMRTAQPIPQNTPDRSIRNIHINRRAAYATSSTPASRDPSRSKSLLWVVVAFCVIGLALLLLMFAFKQTTITVVPRSQTVLFDESFQFTAYPSGSSASGTILYTTKVADFQEFENVTASGTEHKEQKASGMITVVNTYSTEPVRLIKNTRFATVSGLIFKVPAEVVVPGKQGGTPGKVSVTITAEKAGSEYNIAAREKLTLPGLQPNASMYAAIYAETAAPITGGLLGETPSVESGALQSAKNAIQSRLEKKMNEFVYSLDTGAEFALKPIVLYSEEPVGTVNAGSVRVGVTASVSVPIIPRSTLSAAVAQSVTANASDQAYLLKPSEGFAATVVNGDAVLGTDPIRFVLSGTGLLVADVNIEMLTGALTGRDKAAFKAIVANFPGVLSAKARIEPFWNSTFPTDPGEIHVVITDAQNAQD
ncbi:MAG TPA: hypothetical protein VI483_00740 [Candidatus Paceibacterota bacterium]